AAIEAGLSVPSRAPEHVMRLLKNKLEAVDMGFGVDLMMLAALVTEKLHPAQTSLAEKTERPSPEILIDTLTNRLGPNAVRRLFPKASHIPELTQKTRSAFAGVPCWTEPASGKSPRPALLLAKPEDLTVLSEVPEGPPMRFTWRLLTRRVVKAEGPERIAPEWWRSLTPLSTVRPRDYYRIEDEDGCRYWVFREGLYQDNGEPPCWYLHGVFA
ncbi:MAG: DNA polymerase Y family protein, partial [Methyloceanibacter sp.]